MRLMLFVKFVLDGANSLDIALAEAWAAEQGS
jgi:hypothetical protein